MNCGGKSNRFVFFVRGAQILPEIPSFGLEKIPHIFYFSENKIKIKIQENDCFLTTIIVILGGFWIKNNPDKESGLKIFRLYRKEQKSKNCTNQKVNETADKDKSVAFNSFFVLTKLVIIVLFLALTS